MSSASGTINTHGYIMQRGRHAGEPITRVPVGYLKWMVNSRHSEADFAAAELARRGTVTPDIDISGHAIDRASLNCRDIWHQTRDKEEGLHAWLVRVSKEALEEGERRGDKISHIGMLFAFERDGCWPVLKTVMRDKKNLPPATPGTDTTSELSGARKSKD
jgi:hypothetical protein